MPSYVAFLRAINLGATRKFPKDDIRAAVEGEAARATGSLLCLVLRPALSALRST